MEATRWLGHATRLAGTATGRPPIIDLRPGLSAAYSALITTSPGMRAAHALPGLPTKQMALRRSYGPAACRAAMPGRCAAGPSTGGSPISKAGSRAARLQ